MSGIVGSYFNTRGSGVVAKLGTDGQIFTSAGAGLSQGFEAAAGGGKIGQVVQTVNLDRESTTSETFVALPDLSIAITPVATSSKILVQAHAIFGVHSNYTGTVRVKQLISGGSAVYPYLGATGLTASN